MAGTPAEHTREHVTSSVKRMGEESQEFLSYMSMKSDRSMGEPINFKEGSVIQQGTHICTDRLARPESPTTNTAPSDKSIDRPIHFQSGNRLCDSCSEFLNTETQAVKSCLTCSNSYCETHVRKHYTEARFKKHELVDVSRGLELCEGHGKPLEVFCLTDQMFVCSQCSVTRHQGHNIRHETELPGGKGTGTEEPASNNLLPPPGEISFLYVKANSVTLNWGRPEGLEGPRTFKVAWESDGEPKSLELIDMYKVEITGLQPGQKYEFRVASKGDHGKHSKYVLATTYTVVPPARDITVGRSEETSFDVRWSKALGMDYVPHHFIITCTSPGTDSLAIHTEVCHTTLTDLQPDKQYTVEVSAVMNNGRRSKPVSTTIYTSIPAPVKLTVVFVDTTSATVSWEQPDGMNQIQLQYQVSYQTPGTDRHITTSTSSLNITLADLRPASEYSVSVCCLLHNRLMSPSVSTTFTTRVPAPADLTTEQLQPSSVSLRWTKAEGMETIPHHFLITYCTPGTQILEIETEDCHTKLSGLQPGTLYTVSILTMLNTREKSEPISTTINMGIDSPRYITVHSVTTSSISLSWPPPDGPEEQPQKFRVEWASCGHSGDNIVEEASYDITNLMPGREYDIRVATIGDNKQLSKFVQTKQYTEPTSPENLRVDKVDHKSVTLSWYKPVNMDNVSYSFTIKYSCNAEQEEQKEQKTNNSAVISGLKSGTLYTFYVVTMLQNGSTSLRETSTQQRTNLSLQSVLDNLGLTDHRTNKLTMEGVKQIGENVWPEKVRTHLPSQLQLFLKKLLMANMTARNLKCCTGQQLSECRLASRNEPFGPKDINPLDLITALFLCSDGMLQQELSQKMSLCQFAVPLLLPNPETQQSTLMLWAMRDIVKQFRPHCPGDQQEFVEQGIVDTVLPMISFVRCGASSLSKSKFLNEVLSNSQQSHNTFVHHNMRGGNIPKMICNGLVEISWYLPSGNANIDVFPEALALANLRGDLKDFPTQFTFLCQTSAALFVFCDDLDLNKSIPDMKLKKKTKLFIVSNSQSMNNDKDDFKKQTAEFQKYSAQFINRNQTMNDADLVEKLSLGITELLKAEPLKMKVDSIAKFASNFGILVDEDEGPCKAAKVNAAKITNEVSDIPKYKSIQLPLQGKTWKKLTELEKEECKRKKAGSKNIEVYLRELNQEKDELRKEQMAIGMSQGIREFVKGLKSSTEERTYFLKWMKISLDHKSRSQLYEHRKQYKEQSQKAIENKEFRSNLQKLILTSSLGTEHFMRELAQLYEASLVHETTSEWKQEIQELPKICAELMLVGFPLELMDGDASNIPIKWIRDVLKELDSLIKPNNKIRVVSVLGSQSSGKSTLLNTMFGVQFAVSSGRCTRGAFMLLIKVKDEFRHVIKCDFIMVIDTEGLNALHLSQITNNYEHDNELATLVVGLSDISIVNIAMENNSDMKDTLQIVAHAFLRMKGSRKIPCCQFVHQNVTDISAPDKNLREQNLLLEKLNEMTKVASRMENINECAFTDIIANKPEENCNIPGLWHGSPPMAPVNEGYSAAVDQLKQQLSNTFKKQTVDAETIPDFCEWLQHLWTAIKHEKFIFSFRNSLVAQAYNKLCVEFNQWEWTFEKHMYNWLVKAEIAVANYGLKGTEEISGLDSVLLQLKTDLDKELEKAGTELLDKVTKYYKSEQGNVALIEKYRVEFEISAKHQKKSMTRTLERKLEVAVDMRRCTLGINNRNNRDTVEKKMSDLVKKCSKENHPMSNQEIEEEFKNMWNETIRELSFGGLERHNVSEDVYRALEKNLRNSGSNIWKMLTEANPIDKCGKEEFKLKKDGNVLTKSIKKTVDKEGYGNHTHLWACSEGIPEHA
ncbi:interferon-induced very large GTPase 1-like isoform X2 [Hypomesus transpacificus]|uniref:interferon-induced very large GTPase 1-like isoform X2 n=1 Tax=Hypomesus transpacificus TaxID=137520 RepID=UPI001F08806A|nr:interferon-induced very large GTPase 1-like isoform X2 [Hypomesus transpacificus]